MVSFIRYDVHVDIPRVCCIIPFSSTPCVSTSTLLVGTRSGSVYQLGSNHNHSKLVRSFHSHSHSRRTFHDPMTGVVYHIEDMSVVRWDLKANLHSEVTLGFHLRGGCFHNNMLVVYSSRNLCFISPNFNWSKSYTPSHEAILDVYAHGSFIYVLLGKGLSRSIARLEFLNAPNAEIPILVTRPCCSKVPVQERLPGILPPHSIANIIADVSYWRHTHPRSRSRRAGKLLRDRLAEVSVVSSPNQIEIRNIWIFYLNVLNNGETNTTLLNRITHLDVLLDLIRVLNEDFMCHHNYPKLCSSIIAVARCIQCIASKRSQSLDEDDLLLTSLMLGTAYLNDIDYSTLVMAFPVIHPGTMCNIDLSSSFHFCYLKALLVHNSTLSKNSEWMGMLIELAFKVKAFETLLKIVFSGLITTNEAEHLVAQLLLSGVTLQHFHWKPLGRSKLGIRSIVQLLLTCRGLSDANLLDFFQVHVHPSMYCIFWEAVFIAVVQHHTYTISQFPKLVSRISFRLFIEQANESPNAFNILKFNRLFILSSTHLIKTWYRGICHSVECMNGVICKLSNNKMYSTPRSILDLFLTERQKRVPAPYYAPRNDFSRKLEDVLCSFPTTGCSWGKPIDLRIVQCMVCIRPVFIPKKRFGIRVFPCGHLSHQQCAQDCQFCKACFAIECVKIKPANATLYFNVRH